MFGKILGKSKEETSTAKTHEAIAQKVSKMNLTDMRMYLNNKIDSFPICKDGLLEVMKRLNSVDDTTSKKFIEDDAMDVKKKKAFDLVIIVASSRYMSIEVVELIQEFMKMYKEMIVKYDTDNRQIYEDKLITALNKSIATMGSMADMNRKMNVLGS